MAQRHTSVSLGILWIAANVRSNAALKRQKTSIPHNPWTGLRNARVRCSSHLSGIIGAKMFQQATGAGSGQSAETWMTQVGHSGALWVVMASDAANGFSAASGRLPWLEAINRTDGKRPSCRHLHRGAYLSDLFRKGGDVWV